MKTRALLRACCLALVLLLSIGLFAACGDDEPDTSATPSNSGSSNNSSGASEDPGETSGPRSEYEDENGRYVASTSGNTYGGSTITFLVCSVNATYESEIVKNDYSLPEHAVDEANRMLSTLNDAIGDRTDLVEELLGVTVEEEFVHDTGGRPGGAMATRIRQDAMAFTSDYQIVVPCLYDGALLSQENVLLDLNSLNGLQIKAPWWDQVFNAEMTIDGKLFFTIGDIGIGNKSSTAALTWNKDLYKRYNLDTKYDGTPYDYVRNGTWTIDVALEMTREFSEDLNTDGVIDYQDRVGWEGQLDDMWSLFYGAGARIATSVGTASGYPELTMYSERNSSIMDKIQDLVLDKAHYVSANDYFGVVQWPSELTRDNFIAGNALFYNGSMATPLELGDMEDNYGLLPIPKGDKEQEMYNSLVNPWTSTCFAVPRWISDEDQQMVADVLNVMGAASANLLAPVYLDQCLENMKSRDADTKDMIENYILPGRSTDIGLVFRWGGLDTMLHDMATETNRGQFTSTWQSKESAAQSALEETIAAFRAASD